MGQPSQPLVPIAVGVPLESVGELGIALVQAACDPPSDALDRVDIGPKEHWDAAVWNSEWWTDRPLGPPSAWPSGLVVTVDRVVFLVRSEH